MLTGLSRASSVYKVVGMCLPLGFGQSMTCWRSLEPGTSSPFADGQDNPPGSTDGRGRSVLPGVKKPVAQQRCRQSGTCGTHVCEEGEAAGKRSDGDHAQNSLFSAVKEDTLKSVTGQLE